MLQNTQKSPAANIATDAYRELHSPRTKGRLTRFPTITASEGLAIMAASGQNQSIPDLERLLDEKRSRLEDLVRQREELRKQIDKLDQQMHDAATLKDPKARAGKRRMSNSAPLRSVVMDILKKNKKGFRLSDLSVKVVEAGYKSHSSNFQNVVYQCLYHSSTIEQDESTGCYRLKKS
jgi:hypothetical protein